MATTPDTQRHDDATIERERELSVIDELVSECKSRLSGVSSSLLSSATKSDYRRMYDDLRSEAERDELRAERLSWAKSAMGFLESTIDKAAAERATFESELSDAVAKKWIPSDDVASWMATFDDPSLLEMYRSQWLRGEWQTRYRAGWRKLDDDRTKAIAKAKSAGLTAKELPELGTLEKPELFLAMKFPQRRSFVDGFEAKIIARANAATGVVKRMEAFLGPKSKGKDRCLHPAKVGAWLKKIAEEPARYTETVMRAYAKEWQSLRAEHDGLQRDYVAAGKPDGCAPMSVNAFLALPVESRRTVLAEGRNRLDAAVRLEKAEAEEFDKRVLAVRRSVDLRDLDTAENALGELRAERPDDKDLASIAAHVAMLRDENAATERVRSDEEKTDEAMAALAALPDGVPTVLAKHYEYLLTEGNADQAATFFTSMKVRADRRTSGRTDAHDEYMASLAAEETEEAVAVDADAQEPTEEALGSDDAPTAGPAEDDAADDVEVLVTKDTPPAQTIALIRAHGAARPDRVPALVVEGVPYEQHLQLVAMNQRALAHMRHLESMGKPYGNREKDLKAA